MSLSIESDRNLPQSSMKSYKEEETDDHDEYVGPIRGALIRASDSLSKLHGLNDELQDRISWVLVDTHNSVPSDGEKAAKNSEASDVLCTVEHLIEQINVCCGQVASMIERVNL